MIRKLYNLYKEYYHFFYIAVLSISVAVMPHSRGLLSSSEIGLVVMWLLEANFKRKFEILKNNTSILILCSIFLIHIIGLIYTENFSYALKDLRIKLPLLIFPVIIGTSAKLGYKEIKIIITIFTISIVFKTLYGLAVLFGLTEKEITNIQEIAGKFSHIRYALILNIAIFSNFYLLFFTSKNETPITRIFQVSSIIWLSVFLFILHSVTGWIIFFILIIFTGIYIALTSNNKTFKISSLLFSLLTLSFIIIYMNHSVNKFCKTDSFDINTIDTHTQSGNLYTHNFNSNENENGHFIKLYFCEKELKESWNKVSSFKYDGKDKLNQHIKYTLTRYLTSKNYRKDKEGVQKLTKQDINNIENGLANYIYENKYAIYPKIYEILWQLEQYSAGGNPENHSITQRIEFIKIGSEIIKQNFWFGVGTGDVKDEFKAQYKKSDSLLSDKNRLRAHNQYLTFFITFGIFGFIWILFAFIYPIFKEQKHKDYLFLVIFIIMSLSMLNEDTLETQMGATIFAFFISLFLFSKPTEILKKYD